MEGRGGFYVNVMERRPPPAPARAWAMLSPCWAAETVWVIVFVLGDVDLDLRGED